MPPRAWALPSFVCLVCDDGCLRWRQWHDEGIENTGTYQPDARANLVLHNEAAPWKSMKQAMDAYTLYSGGRTAARVYIHRRDPSLDDRV